MAQALVTYYGMSPEVGNISFYDSTGQSEYAFAKPFSEKTAETIDKEVRRMVEEAYNKAKELLISHREQLDQLAAQLYDKEVLFREDLERIYGPRPWETPEKPEIEEASEAPELPENTYNPENTTLS
jgi:cell division protease FtsH